MVSDTDTPAPEAPARRRLPPEARGPQILEAALEEFAARGYAGARMAAVAQRAGIAKGLIYHYFPSKAALFQATVNACHQSTFEAAERQLAQHGGSARAMLSAMVELGYDKILSDRRELALFRLIIAEAENFPDLARFYREEMLGRATAITRALLRAGAASGEFRPEVAEAPGYAEVLLAPLLMHSVWQMILGEDAPERIAMRAAHLDLLLAGLSRQAS